MRLLLPNKDKINIKLISINLFLFFGKKCVKI